MALNEHGIEFKLIEQDGAPAVEGEFLLPIDEEFGPLDLAALVMVLSYRSGYQVARPYDTKVPFADDVSLSGDNVSGRFTVGLQEYLVEGLTHYHLLFSMGPHLSPILEINLSE